MTVEIVFFTLLGVICGMAICPLAYLLGRAARGHFKRGKDYFGEF